ncbi:polyprenyl synthetase family protein [Lysinibacillus xylanilyticus]|uniref:polyprenyl synthetase family protein n=1 Tax=Lysinibacillus xylanilyticus TaxID=582475 RepID=UPI0036D83B5D
MLYQKSIIKKMKDLVLCGNFDESFKTIILNYVNEKNDSQMIFGHLCIIHYQEFAQDNNPEIITIAAAIELIILSFDIMDDLQDNDADYLWCNEPAFAMNATLAMIFLAIKLINESTFRHKQIALSILNDFALRSINGQHLDLLNNCRFEESYIEMITLKSGSLTTLSSLLGTSLALGENESRVAEYSSVIGVIQQIKNDIEDLNISNKKNDLLNKKFSLPIIFLFEQNVYSKTLTDYYSGTTTYLDKQIFKEALMNTGAIHYAVALKNTFKFSALDLIETMSFSEESMQYLKKLME